jgi:hypothetical protein
MTLQELSEAALCSQVTGKPRQIEVLIPCRLPLLTPGWLFRQAVLLYDAPCDSEADLLAVACLGTRPALLALYKGEC